MKKQTQLSENLTLTKTNLAWIHEHTIFLQNQ